MYGPQNPNRTYESLNKSYSISVFFVCEFWCFGGPSQIFEAASLKQKMVIINIQPSVAPILFAINSSRNFQPALAAITFSHHQSIQDVSYIMKEMGIYLTPYDRVVQVEV